MINWNFTLVGKKKKKHGKEKDRRGKQRKTKDIGGLETVATWPRKKEEGSKKEGSYQRRRHRLTLKKEVGVRWRETKKIGILSKALK